MSSYRLLMLGAGFSNLAGLPLGPALFQKVRKRIAIDHSRDNHVESDLRRFTNYLQECFGRVVSPEDVDYEEFLGFLDVEHYLGLKGKDTWSSEGNESQLMIRKAIGQVIHSLTPVGSDIPDEYRRFVSQLTSTDYILTFNYDTLLENTLELEGIPYRLFPYPYSEVYSQSCIIDSKHDDEVVLLKLHGSIDWFSKSGFDEMEEIRRQKPQIYPKDHQTSHPIFGHDAA
jgi:hypothetical protein